MKRSLYLSGIVGILVGGLLVHAVTTVSSVESVEAIYNEVTESAEISWPAVPDTAEYTVAAYELSQWCGTTKVWGEEVPVTPGEAVYTAVDLLPNDGCKYGVIAWTTSSMASTEVYSIEISVPTSTIYPPTPPAFVEAWYLETEEAVKVEWPPVTDSVETIEQYTISRECTGITLSDIGTQTNDDASTLFSYFDLYAPAGTECTYAVRANTPTLEGNSAWSAPVSIPDTVMVVPAAPEYIEADYIASESGVKLWWPAVADADEPIWKYVISRSCADGGSFTEIDFVSHDTSSTVYEYLDASVSGPSECEYAIYAQTDTTMGDEQFSGPIVIPAPNVVVDDVPPQAPTYVAANYIEGEDVVEIEWPAVPDASEKIAYYIISRQCNLLATIQQKNVIADGSSVYTRTDSTMPANDTCTYGVAAYTPSFEGPKTKSSPVVIASSPFLPPPAPDKIEVEYNAGDALIFWQSVVSPDTSIVEYTLYRQCPDKLPVTISVTPQATDIQKMTDKYTADGCEYSVAAVSKEAGEGEQSYFVPIVFPNPTASTDPEAGTVDIPTDTTVASEEVDISVNPFIAALKEPARKISGKWSISIAIYAKEPLANVEVFLRRTNSTYEEPLGEAHPDATTAKWNFPFDSTQKPDGRYLVYSRAVTLSGTPVLGEILHIVINNEPTEITTAVSTNPALDQLIKDVASDVASADSELSVKQTAIETGLTDTARTLDPDRERLKEEIAAAFRREMDQMTVLAIEGDRTALEERKQQIADRFKFTYGEAVAERREEIASNVQDRVADIEQLAQERRAILGERVRADVFKDADNDGISNFDEINIYNTNPYLLDTDGDGIGDGAEIAGKFDPLNERPEAIIEYEEVRDAGVVEPELFAVKSVKAVDRKRVQQPVAEKELSTATEPDTQSDETATSSPTESDFVVEKTIGLEFEGVAPPNSFVTLYIYSTPIIVTVKTDADGNWSYVLDKELEDGSHEVYVAMTDNAGQVYMKSNPLNFVKEAQAVTYDVPLAETVAPSFLNWGYAFGFIALIGLVLFAAVVFIGMRPSSRTKEMIDADSD